MHGGKSTGPPAKNTNAVKHGIYQQHLTDDERELYLEIELGHIDHELRIARIRLARALAAEKAADGKPEIDEVTENEGGGPLVAAKSTKRKMRDYAPLIDRLTGRIESLERTRKLLETADGDNAAVAGFETVPYDEEA